MTASEQTGRLSADKTEVPSGRVSLIDNEKHDHAAQPTATTEGVAHTDSKSEAAAATEANGEDATNYPTGLKLTLILTSLCIAVFLVALDQTIIAPALGAITGHFRSVKDIVRLLSLFSFSMLYSTS